MNGRRYRAYKVRFPERPKRSAREILGADDEFVEPEEIENEDGDNIPF